MKIKELCLKCDKDKVYDEYTKYYTIIEDYEKDRFSEDELLIIYKKFKDKFFKLIDTISSYEKDEKSDMLFFIAKQTNSDFENPYVYYTPFLINKEDLKNNGYKNFTLWNDEGEVRIEHYAYDFYPLKKISQIDIAIDTIENFDINLITAIFLEEIIFMGLDEQSIEARQEEITNELKQALDELKEEECIDADVFFEQLEQELLDSCETQEAREALILDRQKREKHRIDNADFMRKTMTSNHQACIDVVANEYIKRWG